MIQNGPLIGLVRKGSDAAEAGRNRPGHYGASPNRAARSRADVHHSAGAAAPLRRQLHLVRPWRFDALARLRPVRADADRLLSDIPALPLAGHDGLQLPAFLVAHA